MILCAVVSALCAGCGPYIDEVNLQHRTAIEAKLVEIEAVGKVVGGTPTLAKDADPGVEMGIVLSDDYSAKGNAALLYVEDLGNLDELGFVYARLYEADLVQRCSAAMHTEHKPWDPKRPESTPSGASGSTTARWYKLCEGLEYIAVLRTRAFAKPQEGVAALPASAAVSPSNVAEGADGGVNDGGGADAATVVAAAAGTNVKGSGKANKKAGAKGEGSADKAKADKNVFSGGYLSAELLLFKIVGAKFVGGVRFEAESSGELKGSASEMALENDFRTNVEAALKDALAKKAPKVKVRKW